MDLETEWEILPNNGLLEIHDYGGQNISFRKYDSQFVDSTEHSRVPNQLIVPLPNQLNPSIQNIQEDDEVIKEVITKVPVEGATVVENEQDQVSQVFFKKMKETEYENMKLDSPKFSNKTCVSQIDSDPLQFEDNAEVIDKESTVIKKRENMEADIEKNNSGLNLWNWSFTGIGAICSFGIAAAAICIFIGNHQKQKQNKQNQKLKFQFSDDKKMKQVVEQPTKLNEAICGVRGVPITNKRITDVEGLLLRSLEHIQDCLSVS
ncbi:uncharacterized protein LOC107789114 [Nicotiana tabacum]|uniref:Uncharacterized protein LOC107789114 n=2 Tax=Nicotiana TaxID=4085 RepID=A0A1S3ZPY5_TOBAC|nr:PREDICTED: uncharacterized protein LOC104243756 [Nicotiana sylvestris]XP_016466369.1 PREDICTED: uncharacterized protein LOC107789114 [Nicotiana tabacum]